MRPFSRNKEAIEAVPADDVPFQSLRRAPRNTRKPRVAADTDFDPGSPLDPADASKTRARRRLIGAIALALAAIVFVPMLFDRTPVPPADDISLQIPDRDSPFEGRRGVPDPSRAPLRPSSDLPTLTPLPTTPAPVAPTTPVPDASSKAPPSGTAASADAIKPDDESTRAAVPLASKPVDRTSPPPAEKATEKSRPSTTAPASASGDDPRAVAALEGRTATSAAASPTPAPADAGTKSYAVQIAAFSTADKAKSLRDHLVSNGLKSYTESVSTSQGLRTRVRLGPFASRDAADRAKQKLKTMKLDGSVVAL